MLPDQQVFLAHVQSGCFQSGVDRGWWRLAPADQLAPGDQWPIVLIGISAASRKNSPPEYIFRFNCKDYPQTGPTAQPWDLDRGTPLEAAKWPGGRNRVTDVFRPEFNVNQTPCLYIPCDRLAFTGHLDWPVLHPKLIWRPDSNVTLYLHAVHDLLYSSDYTGVRGS